MVKDNAKPKAVQVQNVQEICNTIKLKNNKTKFKNNKNKGRRSISNIVIEKNLANLNKMSVKVQKRIINTK